MLALASPFMDSRWPTLKEHRFLRYKKLMRIKEARAQSVVHNHRALSPRECPGHKNQGTQKNTAQAP